MALTGNNPGNTPATAPTQRVLAARAKPGTTRMLRFRSNTIRSLMILKPDKRSISKDLESLDRIHAHQGQANLDFLAQDIYCAVDPCPPGSRQPVGIGATQRDAVRSESDGLYDVGAAAHASVKHDTEIRSHRIADPRQRPNG